MGYICCAVYLYHCTIRWWRGFIYGNFGIGERDKNISGREGNCTVFKRKRNYSAKFTIFPLIKGG